VFDEHGDAWGRAIASRGLAGLRALDGQLQEARSLYAESAAVLRQVGDRRSLAQTLQSAGRVALRDGDSVSALAILREALESWQHLGITDGSIRALSGLAPALAAQSRFADAVWILGVVRAHAEPRDFALPDAWPDAEGWVSEARMHLGEAGFASACESGR